MSDYIVSENVVPGIWTVDTICSVRYRVKIKLAEGCDESFVPCKEHDNDAGLDLRSSADAEIAPGSKLLVPCGFHMELPSEENYIWEAQVRPRSGLAGKKGISIVNTPGTIDEGYRGEVKVILINHGTEPFVIKRGDRIAQMVITRIPKVQIELVDELSDTDRGVGGFGSTGKK